MLFIHNETRNANFSVFSAKFILHLTYKLQNVMLKYITYRHVEAIGMSTTKNSRNFGMNQAQLLQLDDVLRLHQMELLFLHVGLRLRKFGVKLPDHVFFLVLVW